MHVDEAEDRVRRGWGGDVYMKRIPPVLAGSVTRETSPSMNFPPSLGPAAFLLRIQAGGKARVGQQRHGCKGHVLKRSSVLGVCRQESSTDSCIAQERVAYAGRDFLEKDDIRRFRSLEDMLEDEVGA